MYSIINSYIRSYSWLSLIQKILIKSSWPIPAVLTPQSSPDGYKKPMMQKWLRSPLTSVKVKKLSRRVPKLKRWVSSISISKTYVKSLPAIMCSRCSAPMPFTKASICSGLLSRVLWLPSVWLKLLKSITLMLSVMVRLVKVMTKYVLSLVPLLYHPTWSPLRRGVNGIYQAVKAWWNMPKNIISLSIMPAIRKNLRTQWMPTYCISLMKAAS